MKAAQRVSCLLMLTMMASGCEGPAGADGTDGDDGLNSAIRSVAEPAGANCAEGGTRIDFGLDDDGSGTLDDTEVDGSSYVCDATDGPAGLNSLIAITDIAAGTDECPNSGIRIDYGLDDNDDGTLDAGEVDRSQLLCVPVRRRIVFTTAAVSDGNLGGIAGATQRCQDAADAVPSLAGRTFLPWLSTTSSSPATTFARDGSFVQVTGAVVADSWADLTDGTTDVALDVSETGTTVSGMYAFTGTATDGTPSASSNCADWTSNGSLEFRFGHVDVAEAAIWTLDGGIGNGCSQQMHLYCFER